MSTTPLDVFDTQDPVRLSLFHYPITRYRALNHAKAVGGGEHKRWLQKQIDAVFKGMAFDRDNPREMVLDIDHHCLRAFCFKRPKGQDPLGKTLVKTVIPLPTELDFHDALGDTDFPLVSLSSLSTIMEWLAEFSGSNVPLVGMDAFQETFLLAGKPHTQMTSVAEQYDDVLTVSLNSHWQLFPGDIILSDEDIAQKVSRKRFMESIRGPYPIAHRQTDQLLTYLDALDVTPVFTYRYEGHKRTYGIFYMFEVLLNDDRIVPVSGCLKMATYVDTLVQ